MMAVAGGYRMRSKDARSGQLSWVGFVNKCSIRLWSIPSEYRSATAWKKSAVESMRDVSVTRPR
eukprot:4543012-Pyramimonas_sp.AAC.2